MGLWDTISFTVMDSGPPPSGGFALQRDEATQLVERLQDVRKQLTAMHYEAVTLCKITPPSRDPGTMAYHQALTVNAAGQPAALSYGGGHIDLQLGYVTELINRLRTALGMTEASDETQAGTVNEVGQKAEGRI
ncbi:hypothetical protein [Amycolatopsis sp. PS_44_ISF1]|uniref:hypothetical protein n=1 Tax=Amycolatopsis sp. PS_44_ISF1 TaxID=2974917 RepID=UPI0028DF57D6|nr:hypothetical protein [Amycolatopsis sp. PS_44_ISF1]MDT8910263.1 hypothetical protein [Amycolatopsis sp. PS_44_ISF1]